MSKAARNVLTYLSSAQYPPARPSATHYFCINRLVLLFLGLDVSIHSVTYLDLAGLVAAKGTGPAGASGKLLSAGLKVVHAGLERVGAGSSNGHARQSEEDGGGDNLGEVHSDGGSCS